MLDSFDEDLDRLKNVPLDASLVTAVGGCEAIHSIVHTGLNLMSASAAGETNNLETSPLSPSLANSRIRGGSISDDIDNMGGRLSGSTLRVVATGNAISPVFKLPINMGQQHQQQQNQQLVSPLAALQSQQSQQIDQRKKSFCLDGGSGGGAGTGGVYPGSQLEVGSFDEAYPFQTGEISVCRGDEISDPSESLTLFDCVPADKEKAWATQCNEVHLKVEEKLSQLLLVFKNVSSGLYDISVKSLDTEWLQSIFKDLEDNLQNQVKNYNTLLTMYFIFLLYKIPRYRLCLILVFFFLYLILLHSLNCMILYDLILCFIT